MSLRNSSQEVILLNNSYIYVFLNPLKNEKTRFALYSIDFIRRLLS